MIVTKDEHTGPPLRHGQPADRIDPPERSEVSALPGFPHGVPPCSLAAAPIPLGSLVGCVWKAPHPTPDPEAPSRVLIADADAERAGQLARTLASRYNVRCVGDGEAALAAVLAHGPDVILADLTLLRRRHFKILHALKAGAGTRHVPVVATAAGAGEDALEEALEAGVDDFLLKPFSRSELLSRVAAARARRAAAEERHDGEAGQRVLLETLDDGVFIAQDRRLVKVNRALAALLGYTAEACVGLSFEAVVAPEELEPWCERYRRSVGDGPEPHGRYEVALLRQDGERLALEMSIRRIRHDGRAAMLGILRDTRGRKALEAAQKRLLRMIEASQDFVALSEPDGTSIYINRAGRRLLACWPRTKRRPYRWPITWRPGCANGS